MADPRQTILADISTHLSLAAQHSARATALLNMLHDQAPALDPIPSDLPVSALDGAILNKTPKSLAIWAEWLAEHGPSLRQDVWDGTGHNLAAAAMKSVLPWKDSMAVWDNDAALPDTVCRIQAIGDGRGRPKTIYFLWSQRWDVHPLFGVGPSKPADATDIVVYNPDDVAVTAEFYQQHKDDPDMWGDVVPAPYARFADMDQWTESWSPVLRSLASAGATPDADIKQQMTETLPEGVDPGPALAMAWSDAVRNLPPVLGVVHPPEGSDG